MPVVEFIFRKAGEVFNFTNDRLLSTLGIWNRGTLLLKYFPGDYYLLVWLFLISCKFNLILERVLFGEITVYQCDCFYLPVRPI